MINKILKKVPLGFTLIETLLAVLLLSTAIAGPLTIASKGLISALVAKDQITAFYLAQDAMEYVRYKRDSNCLAAGAVAGSCPAASWLAGSPPLVGAGSCSADGVTTCQVDSVQDTVTSCSGACSIMNFDSSTGYYSYISGTVTPQQFVRTIKITTPYGGNNDEANVEISVTWRTAGVTRTVIVRENITNWQ